MAGPLWIRLLEVGDPCAESTPFFQGRKDATVMISGHGNNGSRGDESVEHLYNIGAVNGQRLSEHDSSNRTSHVESGEEGCRIAAMILGTLGSPRGKRECLHCHIPLKTPARLRANHDPPAFWLETWKRAHPRKQMHPLYTLRAGLPLFITAFAHLNLLATGKASVFWTIVCHSNWQLATSSPGFLSTGPGAQFMACHLSFFPLLPSSATTSFP